MSERDSSTSPSPSRRPAGFLPHWLNPTLLFVILTLLVFTGMLAWTPPLPSFAQQSTATGTATATLAPTAAPQDAGAIGATPAVEVLATAAPEARPTRTPTPIPEEWLTNEKETDGVIFGGIVLVLIVVGGTLHAIRRNGE